MIWDQTRIVQKLRQYHKSGRDLSYNKMSRTAQSLLSAAAYHFGSYRKAIEAAGIDYANVLRRPRWTRQRIVKLIKQANRNGEDLHWAAVVQRRDELGRAAFASLQDRLFGRWDRALRAAGLDVKEVSRYRRWSNSVVVKELRRRKKEGQPLNSGVIQVDDAGLHAAALRYFGSYDQALQAAKINPDKVRRRRRWSRASIVAALKRMHQERGYLSDTLVRTEQLPLHGAAVRLFGTFAAARKAAGVKVERGGKKARRSSK